MSQIEMSQDENKQKRIRIPLLVALLLVLGMAVLALWGLQKIENWTTAQEAVQNKQVVGDQKLLPVTGGPEGPFVLKFEVETVGRTTTGVLDIHFKKDYSLVNLNFDPNRPYTLTLVYKGQDGLIETASWYNADPMMYKNIQLNPDKIRVLFDQ
jgi:hypothetical protein